MDSTNNRESFRGKATPYILAASVGAGLAGVVVPAIKYFSGKAARAAGIATPENRESDGSDKPFPDAPHPIWDGQDDIYFARHENGEFDSHERDKRWKTMPNGERIFSDVGELKFYLVEEGDNIGNIRKRLSKYPEFAYLAAQRGQLDGFNIPARSLQAGMLLPIPLENVDRHMTDEQFANYCHEGIQDMLKDRKYGPHLKKWLQKISEPELIATLIAYAKKESGAKPLGQFEFHRWEPGPRVFSFSILHILMNGPGFRARRTLGLTEGQLYHPRNAVKVFIAYYIEKSKEFSWPIGSGNRRSVDEFFPIDDHWEMNAVFYNGSGHKRNDYIRIMKRHLGAARNLMSSIDESDVDETEERPIPDVPKAERSRIGGMIDAVQKKVASTQKETYDPTNNADFAAVGRFNLYEAIREANHRHTQRTGRNALMHNGNVRKFSHVVQAHIRSSSGRTIYYAEDKVGVGHDATGPYVVFDRNGERALLRLPAADL